MFDTYISVAGTVLNVPERRITSKSNTIVASFRVVSHPRRYDAVKQEWVDGTPFKARVNCWRRLADHACSSLAVGDPVIVYGRITTRQWDDDNGQKRTSYEIEAENVGHDLNRGTAIFTRAKAEAVVDVDDDGPDFRVHGELTQPIGRREEAGLAGPPDRDDPDDDNESDDDALAILRGAGLHAPDPGGDDLADEEALTGSAALPGSSGGRSSRRGRHPVPA